MPTFAQRSFSGGEIAPSLYARVDTVKYATGLRTCRNFEVMRHGGVQNRPGMKYICETKSSGAVRLIPFVFNASQTYVLEFGNLYMRVIKAGAQLESAPGVPYELVTPYATADLMDLQFVQSADVITIVHPSYAPRNLSRSGDTAWTLTTLTFQPTVARPTGLGCSGSGAATITYRYKVTAIDLNTGEESLPGFGVVGTITGITKANPAVVTVSSITGLNNGDEVYIAGIVGMTELNGKYYTISGISGSTFNLKLNGVTVNSSSYTAYTSGGTASRTDTSVAVAAAPSMSAGIQVAWTAAGSGKQYNVYRMRQGIYGLVGITADNYFNDNGQTDPDVADTPPVDRNPFISPEYPGVVSYHQQRRLFANTASKSETVFGSRIGAYNDFSVNYPRQDDDAVEFTLAGRNVNQIRHLVDLGKLVILTSGGEWVAAGNADGVLTPTDVNAKQYGYNGASTLPPIVIGTNALYVQARGSIVRDLAFDFQVDGYKGNDLTIFAAHLFDDYSIVDWAFAQIPHSIVWAVRDDGALLGLTYVPEHQVWAWHRHDTEGSFENVCVVPEGTEDAVYLVVNRTIDGSTVRYIERMHTRRIEAIEDAVFVDCSYTYDGRRTTGSLALTQTTGWDHDDTLTATFTGVTPLAGTADDLEKEIHLYGSDGEVVRLAITAHNTTSSCSVRPHKTVPAALRTAGQTDWAIALDNLTTGLDHLEGEAVSVVGDGFVVANPYNPAYTAVTVTSGAITLDRHYAVIHVGLPYLCDIETLDVDVAQGEPLVDKKKNIGKVTAYLEKSRGFWAGAAAPEDDDSDATDGLIELKVRNEEGYDDPVALQTDAFEVIIRPEWNSNGRVFLRGLDPLPLTVLSVAPSGSIPTRG